MKPNWTTETEDLSYLWALMCASKGSHQPLREGLAVPTYTISNKPKLFNYATWDQRILKKINTARRMQVNLGRTTTYGKPQEKNNQTKLDPLTFFSKIMPEKGQGSRGGQWSCERDRGQNECQEGKGKLHLKPWGVPVSWREGRTQHPGQVRQKGNSCFSLGSETREAKQSTPLSCCELLQAKEYSSWEP